MVLILNVICFSQSFEIRCLFSLRCNFITHDIPKQEKRKRINSAFITF